MAKFLYSMQNVLNIKERLETQAKTEFAEMNNRLSIEQDTMRRLVKRMNMYEQLAKDSATQNVDIVEMRRCNEAIKIIKNQITQQAVRIRIAERNVDNAMKKLTEAVQDVLDGNMTGTVLNDDVGQATKAAEATQLFVEGKDVEQFYWVDYVKVTKDNASQYIK